MDNEIIITVATDGSVKIEAVGFEGANCLTALLSVYLMNEGYKMARASPCAMWGYMPPIAIPIPWGNVTPAFAMHKPASVSAYAIAFLASLFFPSATA